MRFKPGSAFKEFPGLVGSLGGLASLAEKPLGGNGDEIFKNPKLALFNILNVLKFFYSFKDLEKMLGVPSQVLWRYVTLRVVPEKETAVKILMKIREQHLVEEAIRKAVEGSKEPWKLFTNPGILNLAALHASDEFRKSRVEVVLSAPDPYSALLSGLVSSYLRARVCIPSCIPLSETNIVEVYSSAHGVIAAFAVPRGCLSKKSRILIVAALSSPNQLLAVPLNIVWRVHAEVIGIYILVGSEHDVEVLLKATQISSKPRIIVLVSSK
jgi:hypothetical protein